MFFYVFVIFLVFFGLGIVVCVINCVLDVVEKNCLYISDGRLGRRKNGELVKFLFFSKLEEGRCCRRFYSVWKYIIDFFRVLIKEYFEKDYFI